MTPREVLASWSGWGTTTAGDEVADDIIATLDAHGYVIVSRAEEWALLVAGVDAQESNEEAPDA